MTRPATFFAVLLWFASPASSEEAHSTPPIDRLVGNYSYAGDKAKDRAAIDAQIQAAIANMDVFIARIARNRLESGNPIPQRLSIAVTGKDIKVEMDQHVVVAPKDGKPKKNKNLSGHTVSASFHVTKAHLVEDLVQSRGERVNVFRFNDAGELVMQIKESSPELAAPVEYNLVYKRIGPK